MTKHFSAGFFILLILSALQCNALAVGHTPFADTAAKKKIILVYDSTFRYDPDTKGSPFTVDKYNSFKIGEDGQVTPIGKGFKNLMPVIKHDRATFKRMKRAKVNSAIESFFLAWSGIGLLLTIIFVKLQLLVPMVISAVVTLIGIGGLILFSSRKDAVVLEAIKKYNAKNGFGEVFE